MRRYTTKLTLMILVIALFMPAGRVCLLNNLAPHSISKDLAEFKMMGLLADMKAGQIFYTEQGPTLNLKCAIWAVRHGETEATVKKIFQGTRDGEENRLTEKGKKTAEEAAEKLFFLLEEEINDGKKLVILTSQLSRACDTGDCFLKRLPETLRKKVKFEATPFLNEISFGTLAGKPIPSDIKDFEYTEKETLALDKNRNQLDAFTPFPEGESFFDLLMRIYTLLQLIEKNTDENTIVVLFGHDASIDAVRVLLRDNVELDKKRNNAIAWLRNETEHTQPRNIFQPQPNFKISHLLSQLFRETVAPTHSVDGADRARYRLIEIYSQLSSTGIDSDQPAFSDKTYENISSQTKFQLICYCFLDILLQSQRYIQTFFPSGQRSFDAVTQRIDEQLLEYEAVLSEDENFNDPFTTKGLQKLAKRALELSKVKKSYFVKQESLQAILHLNPPANLLKHYEYDTVEQLLQKKKVSAIFSLARYVESEEWVNRCFYVYSTLTADDFEEREIEVIIYDGEELPPEAKNYFAKKLPFSNDKIAGTLTGYALPPKTENRVTRLRALTRALHYIHEVDFYSRAIGMRLPGCREEGLSIGKALAQIFGNPFKINQFFEPHALAEVLFMVEAIQDLDLSQELKQLPFALTLTQSGSVKVTSLIDRITVLSKGGESDLHAKRFLRLAPIIEFWGLEASTLLSTFYGTPEFISVAMQRGVSSLSLQPISIEDKTKDYAKKVAQYLEIRQNNFLEGAFLTDLMNADSSL